MTQSFLFVIIPFPKFNIATHSKSNCFVGLIFSGFLNSTLCWSLISGYIKIRSWGYKIYIMNGIVILNFEWKFSSISGYETVWGFVVSKIQEIPGLRLRIFDFGKPSMNDFRKSKRVFTESFFFKSSTKFSEFSLNEVFLAISHFYKFLDFMIFNDYISSSNYYQWFSYNI